MRWTRLAAVGALAIAGCLVSEAVRPSPVQLTRAQGQGLTAEQLETGRQLFETHCTACHMAPSPGSLSPREWPDEVRDMAARSHLSDDQRVLIVQYLQTVSVL